MQGPGNQTKKQRQTLSMKGRLPIMIDVAQAMLDPTMVFKEPKEVVASNELIPTNIN